MELTTYLLTRNNETTIESALQSISWLKSQIVIGDMMSKDRTVSICEKYGAKIIPIYFQNDYSQAKNELLNSTKSVWQLFIEPWEQIITGHGAIVEASKNHNPCSHYMQILQGQTITKTIRLWNKNLKFTNPVFETIIDKKATLLNEVIINSKNNNIDEQKYQKLLDLWKKKEPISEEPYYYQAYQFLQQKKYDKFISLAEKYIVSNRRGMSSVMLRYHLAIICLYVLNDQLKAIKHTLECIAVKPLMSEFWCLLGDVYYKTNNYAKAMSFYENAIILGKKRLKDEWPIEIIKYKDHPIKMIASCENILKHAKVFASE